MSTRRSPPRCSRDEGHDVTGVTLKLWGGESDSGCCSVSDVEDARRVAAQLDIPHYVFNFADDFDGRGRDAVRRGLRGGPYAEPVRRVQPLDQVRTAARAGARARVRRRRDRAPRAHPARRRAGSAPELLRGVDGAKDQSYVLYMLGQRRPEPHAPPGRRAHEGRGAGARGPARSAHGGEAREHGRVLRHARRSRRVPRRAGAGTRRRHRRHRGPRARRATTASPVSRSGSAAASGSPRATRRYVVDVDADAATVTIGTARRPAARPRRRSATGRSSPASRPHPVRRSPRRSRAHGAPVPAELDGDVVRFERPQPARRAGAGRRALRRRRRSSAAASPPDRAVLRTMRPRFPGRIVQSQRVGQSTSTRRRRRAAVASSSARRTVATHDPRRASRPRRPAAPRVARSRSASSSKVTTVDPDGRAEPEVERRRRAAARRRRRPRIDRMCSRTNSTGSASVNGSTTTTPAGTSTSQRRDRPWSARASEQGDGHADDERDEPEHDRARRRAAAVRSRPPRHDERARERERAG